MSTEKIARKKKTACYSETAGERLKYYRTQMGMSQQELAEGICSCPAVSHFENGRAGLSVNLLGKLADRLKVPLSYIYSPNGDEMDFPVSAKMELVEAYTLRKEFEAATEMIEHLKSGELTIVERQLLNYLQADRLVKSEQYDQAVEFMQPLVDSFEASQMIDDVMLCKYLTILGTAYFWIQDFTKSYSVYKRGYQVSLRFSVFDDVAANVTYNLGLVCNELGLNAEGSIYLEMASDYYKTVEDLSKTADSFFALAIASGDAKYLTKATVLYESLELSKMVQIAKQHQAFYIDSKTDLTHAIQELHQSADELLNVGEREISMFSLCRAVMLGITHNELDVAQDCLLLAEQRKEGLEETGRYIPYYYLAKSRYQYATQDYDECLRSAFRSAELYDNMGMIVYKAEALEVAIIALRESGRLLDALNLSIEVNDTLRKTRRN